MLNAILNKVVQYLKIAFITKKFIREQEKDFKKIPIIIISFNQFKYLLELVQFLLEREYDNIIILDNCSTYKPLLNYLDNNPDNLKIYRFKKNYGHRVLWEKRDLIDKFSKGYYAVTDPDVIPDNECPEDFLLYFKKILDKNSQVTKVGFSLDLKKIPEHNPHKQKILNWEAKFWQQKDDKDNYIAPIDTTFALYKPYQKNFGYTAIRTAPPYVAHHMGWYIDPGNLSDEEKYYLSTASSSSSWRINHEGELDTGMYD